MYIITVPFYLPIDKKMMKSRIWAVIFIGLIGLLALFLPWIIDTIFSKEKREQLKKELKEEETKEPEWKKRRRDNIYRILALIIAVIISSIFFK